MLKYPSGHTASIQKCNTLTVVILVPVGKGQFSVNRHTHTHSHTDTLIAILYFPTRVEILEYKLPAIECQTDLISLTLDLDLHSL